MSFMFGVSRNKPSRFNARKIAAIAAKHDAVFVEARVPGTGYQHWFEAPGMGHPFDDARARAVRDDLRAAGLLDADGRVASAR